MVRAEFANPSGEEATIQIIPCTVSEGIVVAPSEAHQDVEPARALDDDRTFQRALAKVADRLDREREVYIDGLPHTD